MIKQISFLSFVLIVSITSSCDEAAVFKKPKSEIPKLPLPIKIRSVHFYQKGDFPGEAFLKERLNNRLFVGQIETKNFTIYLRKKQGERVPILYTTDKKNRIIDTLSLFEWTPHIGTDSYYIPWILIKKNLKSQEPIQRFTLRI